MADNNQLSQAQRTKILDRLFAHPKVAEWLPGGYMRRDYDLNGLFPAVAPLPQTQSIIDNLKTDGQYADPAKFSKIVEGLIDRSNLSSWPLREANLRTTLKTELNTLVVSGGEQSTVVERKAEPAPQFAAADVTGGPAQPAPVQSTQVDAKAEAPAKPAAGRNKQAPFGPTIEALGFYSEQERKELVSKPFTAKYQQEFNKLPAVRALASARAFNKIGQPFDDYYAAVNSGDEKIQEKADALVKAVEASPDVDAGLKTQLRDQFTAMHQIQRDRKPTLMTMDVQAPVIGDFQKKVLETKIEEKGPQGATAKQVRDFAGNLQAAGWLEAVAKQEKSEATQKAQAGVTRAWNGFMTPEQKLAHAAGMVESLATNPTAENAELLQKTRQYAQELSTIYTLEQYNAIKDKGGIYAEPAAKLKAEIDAAKQQGGRAAELIRMSEQALGGIKIAAEQGLVANADAALKAAKAQNTGVDYKQYDTMLEAIRKRNDAPETKAQEKADAKAEKSGTAAPAYLPQDILSVKPDQIAPQQAKGGLSAEEYKDLGLVGKGTNLNGKKLTDNQRYLRNNLIALGVAKADKEGNLVGADGQSLNDAVGAYLKGTSLDGKTIGAENLLEQTKVDMVTTQTMLRDKKYALGSYGKGGLDGVAGAMTGKAIQQEQKEGGIFAGKPVYQTAREKLAEAGAPAKGATETAPGWAAVHKAANGTQETYIGDPGTETLIRGYLAYKQRSLEGAKTADGKPEIVDVGKEVAKIDAGPKDKRVSEREILDAAKALAGTTGDKGMNSDEEVKAQLTNLGKQVEEAEKQKGGR